MLVAYLQPELQRRPKVYVDDRSPGDASSAISLGENLARSRAMVAIFSADYWTSPWCIHELDLMLDRASGGLELVIAAVVHDCESLPAPIGLIKKTDIKEFRITHMYTGGQKYQDFSMAVGKLAPHLCAPIRRLPTFDATWVAKCVERFTQVYEGQERGVEVTPQWFKPPLSRTLRTLPRLIP
jgi:hypothetical protein